MNKFFSKWEEVLTATAEEGEETIEEAPKKTKHTSTVDRKQYFMETVNRIYTGRGFIIYKDKLYADPDSDRLYYVFTVSNSRSGTQAGYIDVELAESDRAEELRDYSVVTSKFSTYIRDHLAGLRELTPEDPTVPQYYRALSSVSGYADIQFSNCYVSTTTATRLEYSSAERKSHTWVFPVRTFDSKLIGYVSASMCAKAVYGSCDRGNVQSISNLRVAAYKIFPNSSTTMVMLAGGPRKLDEFTIQETIMTPAQFAGPLHGEWIDKWSDRYMEAIVSIPEEEDNVDVAEFCVSDIDAVGTIITDTESLYERIVPRLDSIGRTQDEIKSATKWNNGKLDDLRKYVDGRFTESKSQLTAVNEDVRRCFSVLTEEVDKRFDTMSDKFGSLGADIRELILKQDEDDKKIIDYIANTKGSVEAVRTDSQGIVEMLRNFLKVMDNEFSVVKYHESSIHSGIDTLITALHDVIEYQERILQNQERKGFWNWLKSLFKK